MKTIDFENHFVTQEWVDAMLANPGYPRLTPTSRPASGGSTIRPTRSSRSACCDRLLDLGDGPDRGMDAAGVDVAVLSLTAPGCEQLGAEVGPGWPRDANDAVAAAVAAHPDRFLGYAAARTRRTWRRGRASWSAPSRELGLKGWKTHSNFGDSFIDEKRYWPILPRRRSSGCPIYLHPAAPMIPELRTYGLALAGAGFGFGVETATAMMRLILSGAFDAFPRLQDHPRVTTARDCRS